MLWLPYENIFCLSKDFFLFFSFTFVSWSTCRAGISIIITLETPTRRPDDFSESYIRSSFKEATLMKKNIIVFLSLFTWNNLPWKKLIHRSSQTVLKIQPKRVNLGFKLNILVASSRKQALASYIRIINPCCSALLQRRGISQQQ